METRFLSMILLGIFFMACSKDDAPNDAQPDPDPDPEPMADVYVVSNESGPNGKWNITLWKNNDSIPVLRQPVGNEKYAMAYSVCVRDGYAYTAGMLRINENFAGAPSYATLWASNDSGTNSNYLGGGPEEEATARDVFVTDAGDVYVVGEEEEYVASTNQFVNFARVWKNGQILYTLSDENGGYYDRVNSIFVTGGDVYTVGLKTGPVGNTYESFAVISKNGEIFPLDYNNVPNLSGSAVVVDQDVIYAAVDLKLDNYQTAFLWKDGEYIQLSDGTKNTYATSVFVDGSDYYVTGYESDGAIFKAKLWKNGVETPLDLNSSTATRATDVFVHENDVYVSGGIKLSNTNGAAAVWKNGELQMLPNKGDGFQAYGTSIFVTPPNQ